MHTAVVLLVAVAAFCGSAEAFRPHNQHRRTGRRTQPTLCISLKTEGMCRLTSECVWHADKGRCGRVRGRHSAHVRPACSNQTSEDGCASAHGCAWNTTSLACERVNFRAHRVRCSNHTTVDACGAAQGCLWNTTLSLCTRAPHHALRYNNTTHHSADRKVGNEHHTRPTHMGQGSGAMPTNLTNTATMKHHMPEEDGSQEDVVVPRWVFAAAGAGVMLLLLVIVLLLCCLCRKQPAPAQKGAYCPAVPQGGQPQFASMKEVYEGEPASPASPSERV